MLFISLSNNTILWQYLRMEHKLIFFPLQIKRNPQSLGFFSWIFIFSFGIFLLIKPHSFILWCFRLPCLHLVFMTRALLIQYRWCHFLNYVTLGKLPYLLKAQREPMLDIGSNIYLLCSLAKIEGNEVIMQSAEVLENLSVLFVDSKGISRTGCDQRGFNRTYGEVCCLTHSHPWGWPDKSHLACRGDAPGVAGQC